MMGITKSDTTEVAELPLPHTVTVTPGLQAFVDGLGQQELAVAVSVGSFAKQVRDSLEPLAKADSSAQEQAAGA